MSAPKTFLQLLGAPPTQASPKDSVLIIIDAQNEYAEGQLKITNLSYSRPNIHSLLQQYRAADGYIAHIEHETPPGAPVFSQGTRMAEEFEELKPTAESNKDKEITIKKNWPGSFADTTLGAFVEKSGLKKVVLVGYMAHVCVSTTTREAHQRGLSVVVVEDAVGDRDLPGATGDEVTQMVMKELGDFFATIVKRSEIV